MNTKALAQTIWVKVRSCGHLWANISSPTSSYIFVQVGTQSTYKFQYFKMEFRAFIYIFTGDLKMTTNIHC